MASFKELVDSETRRLGTRRVNGWHEAYGLIREEFEEFWDECKKRPSKRDLANAAKELAQVACLCQRTAEDLGLVEAPMLQAAGI